MTLSKNDHFVRVFASAKNAPDNQIILKNQTEIAQFEISNETQADNLIENDPHLFPNAKLRNPTSAFEAELKQLIQVFQVQKNDTPASRPIPDYLKLWLKFKRLVLILLFSQIWKKKTFFKICKFGNKKEWML